MNCAIERLRHRVFQGNRFAAREIDCLTSLISCSRSISPSIPSFQRVRRNLSMCLKAIAFTLAFETNNKMVASQRNVFSRLVRDQNLRSRPIFHLRQTPVELSVEDAPRSRCFGRPIGFQIRPPISQDHRRPGGTAVTKSCYASSARIPLGGSNSTSSRPISYPDRTSKIRSQILLEACLGRVYWSDPHRWARAIWQAVAAPKYCLVRNGLWEDRECLVEVLEIDAGTTRRNLGASAWRRHCL